MSRRLILSASLLAVVLGMGATTPSQAGFDEWLKSVMNAPGRHAGPFARENRAHEQRLEKASKRKAAKKADPMKAIRSRMVAGKDVTDKELMRLASSGDDLGQFYYAKRLDERDDPDLADDAARFYLSALVKSRDAAERPLIRLLDGGALEDEAELVAEAEKVLLERAEGGNATAREALIRMYREGQPFGLAPDKADALLVAAAEAGDAAAALDLAYAALKGMPTAEQVEQVRAWLKIAAAAEDLSIRTQAENILRSLEAANTPDSTVVSELTP
jgi:TPR repeat protein